MLRNIQLSNQAASTSNCKAKGLNVKEILKTARWSNSVAFARFYEQPADKTSQNFGGILLKQ